MNQKAISDTILQLQAKGDVFTRQVIIEQRRVDDINGVSCLAPLSAETLGQEERGGVTVRKRPNKCANVCVCFVACILAPVLVFP